MLKSPLTAKQLGWTLLALFMLRCAAAQVTGSSPALPADGQLRIIAFGAHPDDCEIDAGGTGALWAAAGHQVKFVSTTNGDIGHPTMAGGPLAMRRTAEVAVADQLLGITSEVLDIHDGELMPTLENRRIFTRLIREWQADIVLGPRPNDYHPDHRYTGILMQDAAFMVTVTFFAPDVPPVTRNPVFLYTEDTFQSPVPFEPDVVVSIDQVIDQKVDALMLMDSQVEGYWSTRSFVNGTMPLAEARPIVRANFMARFAAIADRHRDTLIDLYGEEAGRAVRYAEAFELCEYGRQPSLEELRALFPLGD
ncbi:PIG-L deacetylase family protein [Candidatus Neomarinimicrobiota bacterium]